MPLRFLMIVAAVATSPLTLAWMTRASRAVRFRAAAIPAWVAGGALFALLALHAAMPPLAFDALEYHLAVPRVWLRAGAIAPVAGNFFSHQPFLAEMNFLVGLALGADLLPSVPKFFNLMGLAAVAALTVSLARALGLGRSVRGASALLVVATPLIFKISTDALVDIWVVLGVLAVVAAWRRAAPKKEMVPDLRIRHLPTSASGAGIGIPAPSQQRGALCLAALALGFLAALKHPAAVIWAAPLLALVLGSLLRAGRIRLAVAALALAALPLLPWWAKEWAWTGNPIFPLGHGVLGGAGWSEAQAQLLVGGHGLRSPLDAIFWGDVWHRLDTLGLGTLPLLLGALALAWRRRGRRQVGALLVVLVVSWLIWNLLAHSADRFVAPAVALLVPLGLGGLWGAAVTLLGRRAARLVGWAALAPGLMMALLIGLWQGRGSETPGERLAWITGQRTWGEVTAGFPHLQAFRHLNEIERPAGRVLLVGESRTFHLDAPAVMGTVFDGQPLRGFLAGAADMSEVRARLRAAGITHVMVNWHEMNRLCRFYFGVAEPSADLADTRALWDFPTPMSETDWTRLGDFLRWTETDAALSLNGWVNVTRVE